jgi:uncharacterized protein (DUF2384 family)
MTDLLSQTTETFGDPAVALQWLDKPHPLLDGQGPLTFATTSAGLDKVQALLVALRYGAAA